MHKWLCSPLLAIPQFTWCAPSSFTFAGGIGVYKFQGTSTRNIKLKVPKRKLPLNDFEVNTSDLDFAGSLNHVVFIV